MSSKRARITQEALVFIDVSDDMCKIIVDFVIDEADELVNMAILFFDRCAYSRDDVIVAVKDLDNSLATGVLETMQCDSCHRRLDPLIQLRCETGRICNICELCVHDVVRYGRNGRFHERGRGSFQWSPQV